MVATAVRQCIRLQPVDRSNTPLQERSVRNCSQLVWACKSSPEDSPRDSWLEKIFERLWRSSMGIGQVLRELAVEGKL